MVRITQHVVPNLEGGWSVKKGSSLRASKKFDKKEDATSYAKKLANKQGAELVVHKKNGRIENPNSYGCENLYVKDKVK